MKTTNLVFLIVLIALDNTLSTSKIDFSFAELEDIQNEPYGKNLIETIQMTIQKQKGGNHKTVKEIEDSLDEIIANLLNDQKKADDNWVKEKKRLDKKISELDLEIVKIKTDISKLEKQKADYNLNRQKAINNINIYQKQRVNNVRALNELILLRKRNKQHYDKLIKNLSAIIEALKLVNHHLKVLLESVSQKDHKDWNNKKAKLVEIISEKDEELAAFVEVVDNADKRAVRRLMSLLLNLLRKNTQSLGRAEEHERGLIKIFNKQKINIENDIKQLDENLKKTKSKLDNYVKKINELSITISIKKQLLHSKKNEDKITRKQRREKENSYRSEKERRLKEKRIVQKVKKIFKDRFRKVSNFLRKDKH